MDRRTRTRTKLEGAHEAIRGEVERDREIAIYVTAFGGKSVGFWEPNNEVGWSERPCGRRFRRRW